MEEFVIDLSPEEELLRQAIEPLLDSEGFELVRIKLKKAQAKSLLAVFIDTKNQKNGIVMENLTDVSRLLSDVLDAAFEEGTVLKGRYDLEVSSPGLDRPLSKRTHFKDALNEKVKVRVRNTETFGSKTIMGRLHEAMDDVVVIEPEHKKDERITVAFQDMLEANMVFDFSSLDKNKKKTAVN